MLLPAILAVDIYLEVKQKFFSSRTDEVGELDTLYFVGPVGRSAVKVSG